MPLRPPARAPGDPATRTPPSRPGAPRRAAVPTCAPPAPSRPASRDKKRPPERPEALLSRSWPSATLRRPPARRAPGPAPPRALAPVGSGDRPVGPTAPGPAAATARFSLSLGPEAVLLIQRRHLERQQLARPRRPLPSPEADARSLLGPGPSPGPRAKAVGPRRGRDPGGLGARPPGAPLLSRGRQTPDPGPRTTDLRRVLKVSLLNDQHKYDDVEYEEEVPAVDEDLIRRCTEWLRGVESAAAGRRVRPLDTLPHLSTL